MLANGAKLGYKTSAQGTSYTDIPGLKEIPDMGAEPERVENTGLNDANNQYENGIGDLGETSYTFKYPSSTAEYATSAWKLGRDWQKSGDTVYFCETLKDGAKTEFSAQVSVKRTGGAKNGVVDVQLNLSINSDLKFTDPT